MASVTSRFATKEPTACAVCRRHAVGLGYAPRNGRQIMWLCDHSDCHAVARKVYNMPTAQLDAYEIGAMLRGGESGGQYLDEIGKTDLAALDAGEFREFLRRVLVGYEHALRSTILSGAAPF